MSSESIVNLSDAPPVIDVSVAMHAQTPPTVEQEQISDAVFAPQEHQVAAAVLAMQLGIGLVHTLAAEADDALREDDEPLPPKHKDEDEPHPAS
jgi:hypothetical protein